MAKQRKSFLLFDGCNYRSLLFTNPLFEVDPKSWTVENEIGTGRKHSEEKLFRVLFCLGK